MPVRTRRKCPSVHWLIGAAQPRVVSSKLPSNRQVLQVFLHHPRELSVREKARLTVGQVMNVWERARIPTKQKCHAISKLVELYHSYTKLKKDKVTKGHGTGKPQHAARVQQFMDQLDNLFDIAHANAFKIIHIEEDREFLLAQREPGRRGCMLFRDMKLARREHRAEKRRLDQVDRQSQETQRRLRALERLTGEGLSDGEEESDGDNTADDPDFLVSRKRKRVPRSRVMTPAFLELCDRAKVSHSHAAALGVALLGDDADKVSLSKSTVHRERVKHRDAVGTSTLASCPAPPPVVLHWDGKMLPPLAGGGGKEKQERMAILVTGSDGKEYLLDIPVLPNGTGVQIAHAALEAAIKMNIVQHIVGFSFDTTSTNTGPGKGACVKIEEILNQVFLWLACRHHMHELILKHTVLKCIGPNKGATNPLITRFREEWKNIDPTNFQVISEDALKSDERQSIVTFCLEQLQVHHRRGDYIKFLKMTLIALGSTPPGGIKIGEPVNDSDARWMSKAIYSLYIHIFRGQFKMSKKQERGVLQVCLLSVRVYIKYWFTCTSPTVAPRHDLQLLKDLVNYDDSEVATVAARAWSRHLWYLSERLVTFSLFDEHIPVDQKRAMLINMKDKPGVAEPAPRISVAARGTWTIGKIVRKELPDFFTSNAKSFFTTLRIPDDFLSQDPETWGTNEAYLAALDRVKKLPVVNDCAERGIKLVTDYLQAGLTKDEKQLQYILQIVHKNRADLPNLTKGAVMSYSSK